jgi:hypothetical protein
MNELVKRDELNIKDLIYNINGLEVMLDRDLAFLYQVETKRINEAVRRNKEKFTDDYSFVLSDVEINVLWSQNATANINSKSRVKPRVFTEKGIYMLATILKSSVATEVTRKLIELFMDMREYISKEFIKDRMLINHENRILLLEEYFHHNNQVSEVFFDGQIYDAYSKIHDICSSAKSELIVVDSYADTKLLTLFSKFDIKVVLITTDKCLKKDDIDYYNKQYHNLRIVYNNSCHDRFFIIDKNVVFHCGASFNGIGKKTFAINQFIDEKLKKVIVDRVNNIIKKNSI